MSERKFTRALQKPGMAAQLRETMSQVVRETATQNKVPELVKPVDYEAYILKNKTLLQNDPQRELLLYPSDDVSQVVLPRRFRTVLPPVPGCLVAAEEQLAQLAQSPLLARESLRSYGANWSLVHYKYSGYAGTYLELPKLPKLDDLKEEVFEVDADIEEEGSRSDGITKEGYLLKGPESGQDRMFANLASKTFKRRYCYLRREVDGTHILEMHKAERKGDPKTTIVMDFCTAVVKNTKRGRWAFELRLSGGSGTGGSTKLVCLAAESEIELAEWLSALNSVLAQNRQTEDKRATDRVPPTPPPSPQTSWCGTLKGLEQSMIPELMRYARETDSSIASARQDNRKRLYAVCPYLSLNRSNQKSTSEASVEPYKEQFGIRLLVRCESLSFKLQSSGDESVNQIEPYFTTLALFDAKEGRKLTEDFHFDINSDEAREMLNECLKEVNGDVEKTKETAQPPEWSNIPNEYLTKLRQAILSVSQPHSEVFLVLRVEKVLQGAIGPSTEPYVRGGKDPKLALRVHKAAKTCCQSLGKYRMPFAWSARPLFRHSSGQLDTSADFSALYRQDATRLTDEELLKLLQDFRKIDKMSRLTVIPSTIKISVLLINDLPENCLTSSLAPLKPFSPTSATEPSLEVLEFENPAADGSVTHPYTVPAHHLYVYPRALAFESQKNFAKARNLACTVELRDSDHQDAVPLKCIYTLPGSNLLEDQGSCAVLHHCRTPSWYTELKLRLPVCLGPNHHLLFRFHHIACDVGKRGSTGGSTPSVESCVGYSWLPLLNQGRIVTEEHALPVAANLPPGYLSIQPLGLGKGFSGPEVSWLDGRKMLLTVGLRLCSTLATTDVHLHNLFAHAERLLEPRHAQPPPSEQETTKILKAGHAIQLSSMLSFLPTLLGMLLNILARCGSMGTTGLDTMRLMVHVTHQATTAGRQDALDAFVKYVYGSSSGREGHTPVHEQLAQHMPGLLGANSDPQLALKLMRHSGFFLEIMAKSMAQHLLISGRIKMLRNERFSPNFLLRLEELLDVLAPCVTSKFRESQSECKELNKSIAQFLKRCLSLMDRGAVFNLIGHYVSRFITGEHASLSEYKFSFLSSVCSHEHFVPLNLPLAPPPLSPTRMRKSDAGQPWFAGQLSAEFCKQHFLVGLLLREVQHSLSNETYQSRRSAVGALRDLMVKHELDDRYQNKGQLARIASLYLPWLEVVLENQDRLAVVAPVAVGTGPLNHAPSIIDSQFGGSISTASYPRETSSLPAPKQHRNTLHMDSNGSPFRAPNNRDSACFAAIAGQGITAGGSSASLDSDGSTVSGDALSGISQETAIARGPGSISRMKSSTSPQPCSSLVPCDALQPSEARDILLCFLFVVKHVGDQSLVAWWQHCSQSQLLGFFQLLKMSVLRFRYLGKRHSSSGHKVSLSVAQASRNGVSSGRANTLPARIQPSDLESYQQLFMDDPGSPISNKGSLDWGRSSTQQSLLEANFASEISLIVLDCIGLYCTHFKDALLTSEDSPVTDKIFDIYLTFLQVGQSETLSIHVFAALRAFINNFPPVLFQGTAKLCGRLCSNLLHCCNSRLPNVRQESCAILYLLMRSNFEFTGRQGLTRVHLQLVIAVSQLIDHVEALNNSRVQESLSLINSFANSDKAMKSTGFPTEVRQLTRRVRTVLMATAQMLEHDHEPEVLNELQLSLADSYACTPELRFTWLQALAKNHALSQCFSEAASCHLHMAALQAEYLRQKGRLSWGAEAFADISPNIAQDEKNLKLDTGAAEAQICESSLQEQLERCTEWLDRAERHELQVPLYKLITPLYESRRDYVALAGGYEHLAQACKRAAECARGGKRLLGTYYRVAFYGQACSEESTHGVEFIYKEPKVTSLAELSERLTHQFSTKFGPGAVKIVSDTEQAEKGDRDEGGWVLVTHVTPYWEPTDLAQRPTLFERAHHNVKHFMFDTPFTRDGPAQGGPAQQWKRRTILTTSRCFPYVVRRLPVVERRVTELGPLTVALHEMRQRVADLEEVVFCHPADAKRLQLILQGSVCVQVNAGPMAYATAFLDPTQDSTYPEEDLEQLRDVFRDFVHMCHLALQRNADLVSPEQREYQEVLSNTFQKMCRELAALFCEPMYPGEDGTDGTKRHSRVLFSAISGAQPGTSCA